MPREHPDDTLARTAVILEVHDRELAFVRKIRDGDGDEPSLAVWQERISTRIKELEEKESTSKEWKKLVLTSVLTCIITLVVTYTFSKLIG